MDHLGERASCPLKSSGIQVEKELLKECSLSKIPHMGSLNWDFCACDLLKVYKTYMDVFTWCSVQSDSS